jgi:hypothetical protein
MKPIPIALHGIIDYAAVVIFAAAPTALGLHEGPALLSYALAAVHLLMTLLTDFPAGVVRIVPLWMGVVILAVERLTSYEAPRRAAS